MTGPTVALPMVGSWLVRVHAARPFTIHSDLYYELHVERLDAAGQMLSVRVPQHAVVVPPKPGEAMELTFLMGQITAARAVMD